MILPIYAIGNPVLRQKAKDIDPGYGDLDTLIEDMFETMEESNGIGLAAPQIGLPIRLFVVDATPLEEAEPKDFREVFINARILEEWDSKWDYEEGCLSIPTVRADVSRHKKLKIEYLDRNFEPRVGVFDGIVARIIQHEYDHIEGILFTDRINPLRRTMLKNKLQSISQGRVNVAYRMKFSKK